MTPNNTIYVINQSPELLKIWRELSAPQKREVIKECERSDDACKNEIEKIFEEVINKQRRLF
jgi:hypothetical protein